MKTLLCTLVALVLVSCDAAQRGEIPLNSSAADVRMKMGEPETIWRESGRELWDYPRGPEGETTLRITMIDGQVKEMRNTLSADNFARVQKGMNKEDVRRQLGKPGKITRYGNSPSDVWQWKYRDQAQNRSMIFSVDFSAEGLVIGSGTIDPELTRGAN
ncbi:MAG: putative lipoprotein [Pseudomonadota bacterium]|jgi:hypothetical protein